jgi:hypothetical protein
MIIPSIIINYYNKNNLTSTSDEHIFYIFAILCITIIFVFIIGIILLSLFKISNTLKRIFCWIFAFIHFILSLLCLVQIQIIIGKDLKDNKRIDPAYGVLWLALIGIFFLPFIIDHYTFV